MTLIGSVCGDGETFEAGRCGVLVSRDRSRQRARKDLPERRRSSALVELLGKIEDRYGLENPLLCSDVEPLSPSASDDERERAKRGWLGVSCTVWFNSRHRRSGHL